MLYLQLFAVTLFLHFCSSLVIPEEDDVESLLYVYNQPVGSKKSDIEAERRSALDKNFFRFGRSGSLGEQNQEWNNYDYDFDLASKDMTRSARSGSDKNDNFVRFGRGNTGFVRFGREPTFERIMRDKGSGFIRFGRDNLDPWTYKNRNKRDISKMNMDTMKKNSSIFLRFGKNDNFMRFGRNKLEEATSPEEPNNGDNEDNSRERSFLKFIKKLKQFHDDALLAKMRHDRAKYERLD